MSIYTDKVSEAQDNLEVAKIELELAERQAKEKQGVKGIEKWVGYDFESSCSLTPEFAQFRKEIKIENIGGTIYNDSYGNEQIKGGKWEEVAYYQMIFKKPVQVELEKKDIRGSG